MNEIIIEKADREDATEILELQKIAYVSEAKIIDDFTIPPLHQTLDDILSEFNYQIFLKAVFNGKIIGSVRVYAEYGTCFIGKLIVTPDYQNKGIGTVLLRESEKVFPDARRYELFTGQKSAKNIYIYRKFGYTAFEEKKVSGKLTLVFLEKVNKSTDNHCF